MKHPWSLLGLVAVLGGLSFASSSAADPVLPRISDGVALPSQNPVSTDTAAATLINPANLAFMPGMEARFTVVHTGDSSTLPNRGYALDVALPFWILATGLRVDWMDPPDSAPVPFTSAGVGNRYNWVRWGSAVRMGDWGSFGTTLAWSASSSELTHRLFAASSGLTLRPIRYLGTSVVVRDWNSPSNDAGTKLEPSVDLGLAIRPVSGHKRLELGGTASYRKDVQRWAGGFTLGVDIPYVGALRAGAEILDFQRPLVVANAGIDVNLDGLQLGGGAVFGSAITRAGTGFYATTALRLFDERPKIPNAARVVRLRFGATPDVRQHVRLMQRLWQMARDPEVEGVLLVLKSEPVPSLAHAEEMIDALRFLKQKGKKVLCHLEDASGRELFVCSEADRTAMNPAGGLRFAGLSASYFYLGGLLDKLGIRADFVRIGAYKSAPEQLTHGPTEVADADHRQLIGEYDRLVIGQIGKGRGLDFATAKQRIAGGPFIATEARDAKLVDALAYEDEIDRFVQEAFGRPVRVVDLESKDEAPAYWREPPKLAVVYLHGDMIDGESRDIPIVGIKLAGSYTVARALKQAREDGSVKAVVFRIETGGGSSLASDVILREAALTAKAKPLIVSMGSKAASGGYYAAVAGREIFANRATLTGSIGIFYGKVDVVGLLDKLGVATQMYRAEPRADAESLFRPFTDDEHEVLGRKVKQFYDLFVGRVADGRKLSADAVHAVAQGHVWTGEQAKEKKLVDHVGGIRQAMDRARELGGLPIDAPVVELPAIKKTLFERALEWIGVPQLQSTDTSWIPPPVIDVARALLPFTVLASDRPLARMEVMISEP
jgi:protease-4